MEDEIRPTRKSPGEVLAEQDRILASFIDAWLENQQPIRVRHFVPNETGYSHPSLPGTFTANWHQVEALVSDGKLRIEHLSRGGHLISIPNSVLREIQARASTVLDLPSGESRVTAIYNYFQFRDNAQVVQDSHHVKLSQRINQSSVVVPGNWESLRSALESRGMGETPLLQLQQALEGDEEELGMLALGPRLTGWLKGVGTHGAVPITAEVAAGLILKYLGIG
jgi:hypothetical protein